MTKGWKLRPRCRCFAPGRTPFEQWINSRRGFDISISRFVVDETAIVKQAIEAMSTLRTLHFARLVHPPSIRKATDNGNALGCRVRHRGLARSRTKYCTYLKRRERCATQCLIRENSGVGRLRDRAFDLWSERDLCGVNLGRSAQCMSL
jgi:hypothetical protein